MGYASISQFRSLTNINKDVITDSSLLDIFKIADRLVNKMISVNINLEQLDGKIDGTNKDFRTGFRPIVDTDLKNEISLDDCDTADWTESTDAAADALSGKIRYGDSSIRMGKDGTSSSGINYTKTAAATVDGTERRLKVTIFIKDTSELAVLNAIELRVGNANDAYYEIKLDRNKLKNGINELDILITDMGTTGTPAISTLDYMYIGFETTASSDTITSGNLKMDYWRLEDIDSPDTADVEVFYATQDDDTGFIEYGSVQAVTSFQAREGIITMTTAPTTTTAESGVFCNYAYTTPKLDFNLINTAACYMAAHLSSFKIAGTSPNYTSIQDAFARRDIAGTPDEWLRLCYSIVYNALGNDSDGVGFKVAYTRDLT